MVAEKRSHHILKHDLFISIKQENYTDISSHINCMTSSRVTVFQSKTLSQIVFSWVLLQTPVGLHVPWGGPWHYLGIPRESLSVGQEVTSSSGHDRTALSPGHTMYGWDRTAFSFPCCPPSTPAPLGCSFYCLAISFLEPYYFGCIMPGPPSQCYPQPQW